MTIEQSTLNACNGDTDKYNLILKRTRQADIVKLRWEVFVILSAQGFTQKQISEFFNIERSSVSYGVNKALNGKNRHGLYPISATLMREVYKSIPSDEIGLVIEALRLKSYSFVEIGDWFNITSKKARYLMMKETTPRDLELKRKRIIKFK